MSDITKENIKEYLRIKALIDGDRSIEIIKKAHIQAKKELEEERKINLLNKNEEE